MDESILMNYLRGGCNDEECQQVELWCEEAPENRQILEQLYYTLFVGDRMAVMDAVDTEASLTKFKSLVREKEKKAKRRSISVRWGRYASATAAFLAGLVFAGGIAWGLLSNKLSDYTVMTTGGQRAQTVLPDGSKVWLNASTKLIYRNSFWSTDRQIDLSGEAYFEVARDKHAPFIVNTKHIKTCVLGTKFNVMAYSMDSLVITTLLEGSVRLTSAHLSEKITLHPNEQFTYNRNTKVSSLQKVDARQFVSWTSGYYYFPGQSLEVILDRLSHVYGVKFTVLSEDLYKKTFTGTFYRGQSIKDIMEIVNLSIPIKYKIDDRHITVSEI